MIYMFFFKETSSFKRMSKQFWQTVPSILICYNDPAATHWYISCETTKTVTYTFQAEVIPGPAIYRKQMQNYASYALSVPTLMNVCNAFFLFMYVR